MITFHRKLVCFFFHFSDDYCNLMLGYKLQLRSGLRINQRRTQAFAAAAAHPGKENFYCNT